MIPKKVLVICFLGYVITGFFVNCLASESESYQNLSQPVRIDYKSVQGPIKEVQAILYNLSRNQNKYGFRDNIFSSLEPGLDTLRNHDRLPSFYYTSDSVYYATRLTVPNYAASACTIKVIRFGLTRPRSSATELCSLFVWNDTIIDGEHQPGIAMHRGIYFVPSWPIGFWSWLNVSLTSPIVFNPTENFWLGFFCFTTDFNQLADGSENLDTTRNAIKTEAGVWISNRYDFLQEAVVAYTPVDSNVGVIMIDGVNKIVTGNTTTNVVAKVKNFGRTSIPAGMPVTLRITGSSTVYETTGYTPISLGPNDNTNIAFSPWQFPNTAGDYEILVWTNLINDPVPGNDTARFVAFVYSHGIVETFLSPFPPAGWTVFNFNGDNQWARSDTFLCYADWFSARILWDPVSYAPNNDWLITPRFKATPEDSIIFWYRAAASEFYETLLVRIDTITSSQLDTLDFSIIIDTLVTNNTNWQHRIIPFNRILTDSARVFVAFHYPCYNHFYIAIDDVITPRLDTIFDFYPISIDAPKLPIIAESSYVPSATFRNNSISQDVVGLYVFYYVAGNTTFYKESAYVGFGGGNNERIKFTPFVPNVAETVWIKVWTAYPSDANLSNDTISQKVFIAPKYQTPLYIETFDESWGPEGDNPPLGGWLIIAGGTEYTPTWNTNDWHKDTCRTDTISLRQVAQVLYSPIENQLERLISPRIDCSNPGIYNLSFWHWYRDYNPSTPDSGVVLISNDGGTNWTRIARYLNVSDSGIKTFTITSHASGSSNVKICFLYGAYSEYWWCIDDFSVEWIPLGPVLLTPANNFETPVTNIYFSWQMVAGVSVYEIQVAYDSLFNAMVISDTVFAPFDSLVLEPTTYWWRVRAGMPFGQWSATQTFTIFETGWHKYADILTNPSGKNVKDGGALVFCSLDSNIYALKGNNTRDFYAFNIRDHAWREKREIAVESLKIRKVKKGATLCFGDSLIYMAKGNNSNEFWIYNPRADTWIQKRNIPGLGLKAGSGLAYVPASYSTIKTKYNNSPQKSDKEKKVTENGYVYLLKGSSKEYEFLAYSVSGDSWVRKQNSPAGPDDKIFKGGSALVFDGDNKIYALKGGAKVNEFYFYDVTADTWSLYPGDTIPLIHPSLDKKKKIKNGGTLTVFDNVIYAIKGGGSNEFWCYAESVGQWTWIPIDTIPRLNRKSVPKAGAALTSAFGIIYLLKGNNTVEFWAWVPEPNRSSSRKYAPGMPVTSNEDSNLNAANISTLYNILFEVKPNPCKEFTTISYTTSQPTPISVKLYDATGRVLKTIQNDNSLHAPGRYHRRLSVIDLSPGVYFIGLSNGQRDLISKLIIQ